MCHVTTAVPISTVWPHFPYCGPARSSTVDAGTVGLSCGTSCSLAECDAHNQYHNVNKMYVFGSTIRTLVCMIELEQFATLCSSLPFCATNRHTPYDLREVLFSISQGCHKALRKTKKTSGINACNLAAI